MTRRNVLLWVGVGVLALLLAAFVYAQDTTEEPAPIVATEGAAAQPLPQVTLAEVARDTTAFAGQVVTVDGTVAQLLNPQAFLLDGEGLFGGGQAIVINGGSEPFSLELAEGRNLRVTGSVSRFVRASLAATPEGGQPVVPTTVPPNATDEAVPTADVEQFVGAVAPEAIFQSFALYDYTDIAVITVTAPADINFIVDLGAVGADNARYLGRTVITEGVVDVVGAGGFEMTSRVLFGGNRAYINSDTPVTAGQRVEVVGTVGQPTVLAAGQELVTLNGTRVTVLP